MIRRVASNPSITGIRTSISTTSGSSRRASRHGLEPVAGLGDDLDVGLSRQQHGEAAAHQGLVVGDDDTDRHAVAPARQQRGDAVAAARSRTGVQLAAPEAHPLAHADHAVAVAVRRRHVRVVAAAVVDDLEGDRPGPVADDHVHRVGDPACLITFVRASCTMR